MIKKAQGVVHSEAQPGEYLMDDVMRRLAFIWEGNASG
jgi:hypothetical protein